jgi:hypothetical protein
MPAEWQIRHWLLATSAPMPGGKDLSLAGNSTLTIVHGRGAASFFAAAESALAQLHKATAHAKDNIATHGMDTNLMARTLLSMLTVR